MPLIRRRRIPLPFKHMPQMAATVTTHNLRPRHPKRDIRMPRHRPRNAIEIRRPPTTRLEFMGRFVKRRVAGGAGVGARGRHVFVVGAGVGRFGAFLAEDAELLCIISPLLASVPIGTSRN